MSERKKQKLSIVSPKMRKQTLVSSTEKKKQMKLLQSTTTKNTEVSETSSNQNFINEESNEWPRWQIPAQLYDDQYKQFLLETRFARNDFQLDYNYWLKKNNKTKKVVEKPQIPKMETKAVKKEQVPIGSKGTNEIMMKKK